jgi:hypothetical protein
MSKRSGGGAIRIAVAATSAVRRAGLESIIRSHADFHLSGSFGAVASMVPFARNTELDVIVIDSDSIRDLLLEPITRCYSFEDFHWTIPRDGRCPWFSGSDNQKSLNGPVPELTNSGVSLLLLAGTQTCHCWSSHLPTISMR